MEADGIPTSGRDDDRRHEERPFDGADRREEDRRSIVGRRQVWQGRVSS